MKQHPKSTRPKMPALAALACPACELCAKPTRFVGLESVPHNDHADLCTYECTACGNIQTGLTPRSGNPDSELAQTRH